MFNLSPKDDKFFDFFIDFSKIAYEASEILNELTADVNNCETHLKAIEELEHKGDKQLHDIMESLYKTFITPLDREDIYAIAKSLDDIVDCIEAVSSRFVMFNVHHSSDHARVLSNMICQSCKEVIKLMEAMKNMKNVQALLASIIEINRLEDQGDHDFRVAVRSLFAPDVEPINVIKWREIYELFEQTLDACEDVANIIEGVVMKHA